MTENTSFLEGLKCQECGSLGPFWIDSTCTALWSDDGTESISTLSHSDDSLATCVECDAGGTVAELLKRRDG